MEEKEDLFCSFSLSLSFSPRWCCCCCWSHIQERVNVSFSDVDFLKYGTHSHAKKKREREMTMKNSHKAKNKERNPREIKKMFLPCDDRNRLAYSREHTKIFVSRKKEFFFLFFNMFGSSVSFWGWAKIFFFVKRSRELEREQFSRTNFQLEWRLRGLEHKRRICEMSFYLKIFRLNLHVLFKSLLHR